jgi:hypothetical protein
MNYMMIHRWRNLLTVSDQYEFLQAYDHLAMSFGDVSFAYYGFVLWLIAGMYLGTSLSKINRRARSMVAEGRECNSSTLLMSVLPIWQIVSVVVQAAYVTVMTCLELTRPLVHQFLNLNGNF